MSRRQKHTDATPCRDSVPERRSWVIPAVVLLAGIIHVQSPKAADWPQFRGPSASGVDDSRPAPITWSLETGSNILWRTRIAGLSHAAPIISGDRVYVLTAVTPGDAPLKTGLYGDITSLNERDPHQWRLIALDRDRGLPVWDTLLHEGIPRSRRHPKASAANSTPATDGRRVVALAGSEGLFCLNLSGAVRWRKDLGPMDSGYFRESGAQWGFASSPILHEDRVIVLCDVQTNSFLAAFDADTGRELWRTKRTDVPTWSTPTVVTAGGRSQIAVNGWHETAGYDPASGTRLWWLDGGGDIPVPTPIQAHGLIYFTSAHGPLRPMRAIRPDASGNITPAEPGRTNQAIAWVHPRQGNYMQTPICVGDWLWGCADTGILTCFEARTGAIRYSERLMSGPGYTASPVSDGRHLYFTSEAGDVFVVPARPEYAVQHRNSVGESCLATPALSDGTLFFRTRNHLLAVRSATVPQ